jgi:classical protein kinase C
VIAATMTEDDVARDIRRKIDKERTLINGANAMRQSTNNPAVVQGLDTKIRDGRKNIDYLESRLRELEMKKVNQGMDNMSMNSGGGYGGQSGGDRPYPNRPGEYGTQEYSQIGGNNGMMPPSAPFARPGPGSNMPKGRPNYSKLGMCAQVLLKWHGELT